MLLVGFRSDLEKCLQKNPAGFPALPAQPGQGGDASRGALPLVSGLGSACWQVGLAIPGYVCSHF